MDDPRCRCRPRPARFRLSSIHSRGDTRCVRGTQSHGRGKEENSLSKCANYVRQKALMIWRCPFVAAVPISLVGRRENERAERASAKEIEERQRRETALERLRDAKRVYERTTKGRARDAAQELHNAAGCSASKMSTGLLTRERPAVTEVVAWAASNGDRSENAD